MKLATLKALHAEWRKLSVSLAAEGTEREARLAWSSKQIPRFARNDGTRLRSFNDLTEGEGRRLLRIMRQESGSQAEFLTHIMAELAIDLTDSIAYWDLLTGRCRERFHKQKPQDLAPAEAHAVIEELLSRIARRDGIEIEEARRRVLPQKAEREASPTEERR